MTFPVIFVCGSYGYYFHSMRLEFAYIGFFCLIL